MSWLFIDLAINTCICTKGPRQIGGPNLGDALLPGGFECGRLKLKLTDDVRKTFLDAHNDLRRNIAHGKQENLIDLLAPAKNIYTVGVDGSGLSAGSKCTRRDRAAHDRIATVANLGSLGSSSSHLMINNKKTNQLSRAAIAPRALRELEKATAIYAHCSYTQFKFTFSELGLRPGETSRGFSSQMYSDGKRHRWQK
ncbi:hypothetical protein Y032_0069g402 [Ancylostoma ceylanicum]|uniref:SCP domain-containing protein n=1 Tax=Ancylostoma ceylanicum TaxID=53326 RepID=A0A016TYW0_9BILA|nr:hypothetical protein Y032_0069g402 [Ancylostoma ceylanicum]